MAYIGRNPGGGHASFFEAVEFGAHNDARRLSPLADSNMILNNGGTILPMRHFNRAPIIPTTGLLYSGETVLTGFTINSAQIRLCKPGSRPRFYSSLRSWEQSATSNVSLTRFINRFSDGEVWISTTQNARTGTKISKALADWNTAENLPRGVRYVMALLIGGGGGGGGAGGSLQHSGSGGGGGACAACCIRLPENGNATITIGGWGNAGTNYGAGGIGGFTRIASGSYWCQAGAGNGGLTGTSSTNTAFGGSVTSSGNNADGVLFASVGGGNGPGKNNNGTGASFAINDYAPANESSSLVYNSNGGASGGSTGGGGGGASAYYGPGGAGGNGAPGSNGQGYGGGGGGGGVAFLQQHNGGRGAPGHVIIRY